MSLRVAVGQQNFWVGDVHGNVDRVIRAAVDARDRLHADLLVCPEMCLLGYPPDDLLLRPALGDIVARGVERLVRELRGITVVAGLPEFSAERRVYNAAIAVGNGVLLAHYRKRLLPRTGIFDEQRYFSAGTEAASFECKGLRINLCIGEDTWRPGAVAGTDLSEVDFVVSINASAFERGKRVERRAMLAARSREAGVPILYANAVGGQDDLVFDGGSCAVNVDGGVSFQAPAFAEGLFACDYEGGGFHGERAPDPGDAEAVYGALVVATRDYAERNAFPGVLVGLSGEVGAAVVAAIAVDALGAGRVWTVGLPADDDPGESKGAARELAQALGVRHRALAVAPIVRAARTVLDVVADVSAPTPGADTLVARARGLALMELSKAHGYLLLATGDKSSFALGSATLYGDMWGGFAPIKDLYRTRVRELARYRNGRSSVIPEALIDRSSSHASLEGALDVAAGAADDEVDAILEAYVDDARAIDRIVAEGHDRAFVARVASMVRRAEYKRRQAPPGPKVTRRAFGRERRYPITAVYSDL